MGSMGDDLTRPRVTRAEIEQAARRIHPFIRRTPTLELGVVAQAQEVTLKLECLQVTGSFKPRGAFNRLSTARVGASGVLAASGGNFGVAVAYAARVLGHRAEIFVPESSPEAKIRRIRDEGAKVHVIPGYYPDAAVACEQRSLDSGALVMHPYDQPTVVAGQGTVGMELDQQVPGLTTVLVAVGGAGLIGGIASWFGATAKMIGVESERCSTLHSALAAGEPIDVEVGGIAADSLGARRVGTIGFAAALRYVDEVVLVPDEAIVEAQRWLWQQVRLVAEPGGAASLAAILCGAYVSDPGERIVAVICGANTDPVNAA